MSFVSERLYILGCLVGDPHNAFIYDSSLRTDVRRLLSNLEASDDQERGKIVRKLANLYDSYGPGVWKCILEFSFLLHTTSDAQHLFAGILDRLEGDLRANPELSTELINELGWYARTPYDFTYKLVDLSLERLSRCGGALSELIQNKEAEPALRLAAARQVVAAKNQAAYRSILQFFAHASNEQTAESYSRLIKPLVDNYSQTGRSGLAYAIESFEKEELGSHGPLLLASFRSVFAATFLSEPPQPSIKWARVILIAWRLADSATHRNNLLSLLINEWCAISKIAYFVRKKLQKSLRNDRRYLEPARRDVTAMVLEFTRPKAGQTGRAFENKLRIALREPEDEWRKQRMRMPLDGATGAAAASILISEKTDVQERIFVWIESSVRRSGFQRSFFKKLIRLNIFQQLPYPIQLRLIQSGEFVKNVTSEELNQLLLGKNRFREDVVSGLKTSMLMILRESHFDKLDDQRSL